MAHLDLGVEGRPSCILLGLPDDERMHFTFPYLAHRCHARKRSEPVDLAYQETHCLTTRHEECERYQAWAERNPQDHGQALGGIAPDVPAASVLDAAADAPTPEGPAAPVAPIPSSAAEPAPGAGDPTYERAGWGVPEPPADQPQAQPAEEAPPQVEPQAPPQAEQPGEPPAPPLFAPPALEAAAVSADPQAVGLAAGDAAQQLSWSVEPAVQAGELPQAAAVAAGAPAAAPAAAPGVQQRRATKGTAAGVARALLGLVLLLAVAGAAGYGLALLTTQVLSGDSGGAVVAPPGQTTSARPSPPTSPIASGAARSITPGSAAGSTSPRPAASATPSAAATPRIYVVKAGDYLSQIASRFGVSVAAIVQANNLANPNVLIPGQKLIIPPLP